MNPREHLVFRTVKGIGDELDMAFSFWLLAVRGIMKKPSARARTVGPGFRLPAGEGCLPVLSSPAGFCWSPGC